MGVNRVGFGIIDDEVVKEASNQEIISRYFKTGCEYKKGYVDKETYDRAKLIMEEVNLKETDRRVVVPARETDMGVNRVGFGIIDDEVVKEASNQEIISRYFKTGCEYKKGYVDKETYDRAKLIMEEVNLNETDRRVVVPAREKSAKLKLMAGENEICPAVALELHDGTIVTGKSSSLMDAAAAATINAIKHLAKIADDIFLISPVIIEPINN